MDWIMLGVLISIGVAVIGWIIAWMSSSFKTIDEKQEARHEKTYGLMLDMSAKIGKSVTIESCVINNRELEGRITKIVDNKVAASEIVMSDKIDALDEKQDATEIRIISRLDVLENKVFKQF